MSALTLLCLLSAFTEPIEFTMPGLGFRVRLPVKPIKWNRTARTPDGEELSARFFACSAAASDGFFLVGRQNVPTPYGIRSAEESKLVLDAFEASWCKEFGATLRTAEPTLLGRYPGRRLLLERAQGRSRIECRIYCADAFVVMIAAFGSPTFLDAESTLHVLASLRIDGQDKKQ